jgi:hypothetical protein
MSKKITDEEIKKIATDFGLTWKHVKTILLIESAGSGFDSATGKIKIQFEPHVFHKQLALKKITSTLQFISGTIYKVFVGTKVIENKVDVQSKEWVAFEQAKAINEDAAYRATSFGLGQIMGFNCLACGFKTAKEMADNFDISEANQLKGMMAFIKASPKMFNALKTCDWNTFASMYNGPAYKKFLYDTKLTNTYNSLA